MLSQTQRRCKGFVLNLAGKLSEEERGGTSGTRQKYRRYPPGGARCGTWYLFFEKIQQVPEYKRTISSNRSFASIRNWFQGCGEGLLTQGLSHLEMDQS
jgi:hypothetical protein